MNLEQFLVAEALVLRELSMNKIRVRATRDHTVGPFTTVVVRESMEFDVTIGGMGTFDVPSIGGGQYAGLSLGDGWEVVTNIDLLQPKPTDPWILAAEEIARGLYTLSGQNANPHYIASILRRHFPPAS